MKDMQSTTNKHGQHGVALVVALILLVVITLIGIAASSGTILQQKMSSNFYDRALAFQATEAALQVAETSLPAPASTAPMPASIQDCSPASAITCGINPFDTAGLAVTDVGAGTFSNLAAGTPQYIIQYLGTFPVYAAGACKDNLPCINSGLRKFYRVTARSGDPDMVDERAIVQLQMVYKN